jgi:hypothetical protein
MEGGHASLNKREREEDNWIGARMWRERETV